MKLLTEKQYRQETETKHKSLQDKAKLLQGKAVAARDALKKAKAEHQSQVDKLSLRVKRLENELETLKVERDAEFFKLNGTNGS